MRRLFLRDCCPGDTIEDVFVISNKQLGATQTGKHFIKAFVSDRTAQLNARMWNATKEIFNEVSNHSSLIPYRNFNICHESYGPGWKQIDDGATTDD